MASGKGFSQYCLNNQGQVLASYEAEFDSVVALLYSLINADLQVIREV